ncbi:hypothetical protein [Halopseudomonas pelagia]|uniref:hypothetical protein n=1 Tax=Halopseudomonas pelagia TaxID=553151 RepID=UPI00039D1F99|nr:hypothetical protein [Halopseudomonas pelagia]
MKIYLASIVKSSIFKATALNQISVLTNIGLGIVLIPFIYNYFGVSGLAIYLELIALKAIVDIFTAALGGGIVRHIADGGGAAAFNASLKLFTSYAIIAVIVCYIYFTLTKQLGVDLILYFSAYVCLSLIIQPFLQRATACGYQQLGPVIRISQNALYFVLLVLYIGLSEHKEIDKVFTILAATSFFSLVLVVVVTRKISINQEDSCDFTVKDFALSLSSYAIFAIFFSICAQIEVLFLNKIIVAELFAVIIASWKIPNILVQLLWRYCEVKGVALKVTRNSQQLSKSLPERGLLVVSLIVALSYYVMADFGYELWMGSEFNPSATLIAIFAIGIVPMTMNRLYTGYLQFTSYATILGWQYFTICIAKILYIVFMGSDWIYGSFVVWFVLESIFCLINRKVISKYI